MTEIEQLNNYKEFLQEQIKFNELLNRLNANPDFKAFVKAYTEDEALRCIQFSIHPSMNKEDLLNQAMATAHFKNFIKMVSEKASSAATQLDEVQDKINELMVGE